MGFIKNLLKIKTATTPKSSCRKTFKLITIGDHYNLCEIYDEINKEYFRSRLQLGITWYNNPNRIAKVSRTLGVYDYQFRLIKIHRIVDNPAFPDFFLSYLVYHEMLHHTCPPKRGKRGKRAIHHEEFKEREKRFHHYGEAKKWEKQNLHQILNCYGRTQQMGEHQAPQGAC